MQLRYKGRPVNTTRIADAITSRVRHHFVNPVIGTVPRLFLGNDAGIRSNVVGRQWLSEAQKARRERGEPEPAACPDSEELRREGWVAFDDPGYPEGLIARIRERYLEELASEEGSFWGGIGEHKEASRFVNYPGKAIPEIAQLLTPRVRRAVEAYYGSPFEVMHIRAWRTKPVAGLDDQADAYSNQWHSDQFPTSMLRLFVYLSDGVTRETGAFRLHSIPSTKRIFRSGGYVRRDIILPHGRKALDDTSRIVYFEGDAGRTCLCNVQLCLHRAGVPRAGYERDLLQMTFRPSTKPLPEDWIERLPRDKMSEETRALGQMMG